MTRLPEPPPPLRWSATFSSAPFDGRMDWRPGSLFLDRPHNFFFLRDDGGKIVEGRLLREKEWILPGLEMVPVDGLIRLGHRVFPARRRLTLAPGAIATGSGSVARSPAAGSRFELLAIDEGADLPDAEGVAVQAANMVLPQADHDVEDGPWSSVSRRKKSKEELMQEFWNDVGFPTPASRVWERRGSTSLASSAGHTPVQLPGGSEASPAMSRSPPAPTGPRRGVGIRPWKGPLPRPRVTPLVELAAFLPSSQVGPSSSTVPSQPEETAQSSAIDPDVIQKSLTRGSDLQARGPDMCVANRALRLGQTLRRADLFQYRASRCPSAAFVVPSSSTLKPPPPSYAQVLRRSPSPSMAGRNGNPPNGAAPAGQVAPSFGTSPGISAGFGVAAGPLRFGAPLASSSTAAPSVQQAPTPAPVRFGANIQQTSDRHPPYTSLIVRTHVDMAHPEKIRISDGATLRRTLTI